eukprot:6182070-Pleurochrysis_carterae.AAC.1
MAERAPWPSDDKRRAQPCEHSGTARGLFSLWTRYLERRRKQDHSQAACTNRRRSDGSDESDWAGTLQMEQRGKASSGVERNVKEAEEAFISSAMCAERAEEATNRVNGGEPSKVKDEEANARVLSSCFFADALHLRRNW